MDDQLYNQIFLKPRFQIEFNLKSDVLLNEISKLGLDDSKYSMKIIDNHIVVDVPENETHFWSPQLHIEIEELTNESAIVKGLFGPKPQVWTFFMFLHFFVATAFLIFGIIAYSNWSLGKTSLLPVVMLVVLPIVWILLYFIGSIGKSTGKKQMDELKTFTKELLHKIKST